MMNDPFWMHGNTIQAHPQTQVIKKLHATTCFILQIFAASGTESAGVGFSLVVGQCPLYRLLDVMLRMGRTCMHCQILRHLCDEVVAVLQYFSYSFS